MRIAVTESASDDIPEGYLFYESQENGLGSYFETSILSQIRSLQIFAGLHEIHFDNYYRMITRHFPYAVYYRIEGDVVLVYAVVDTRRSPEWISDKLN